MHASWQQVPLHIQQNNVTRWVPWLVHPVSPSHTIARINVHCHCHCLLQEAARRALQAEIAEQKRRAVHEAAEKHRESVRQKLEAKLARVKPRYVRAWLLLSNIIQHGRHKTQTDCIDCLLTPTPKVCTKSVSWAPTAVPWCSSPILACFGPQRWCSHP